MTYCKHKPRFCVCQPDEGVSCPYAAPAPDLSMPSAWPGLAAEDRCDHLWQPRLAGDKICVKCHKTATRKPAEPPATEVLHVLRNPHGYADAYVRAIRCEAADLIERQAREIAALSVGRSEWHKAWIGMEKRAERAEAERDAARLQNDTQASLMDGLREDAERYRWLRDEAPSDWIGWAEERDAAEATAPEVDAAIDRARASQPGGQERSSVGRTDVVAGSSPAASVSPDPTAAPAQGEPQERIGTHWDGCAIEGGPRHYDCAIQEIAALRAEVERQAREIAELQANFDGLDAASTDERRMTFDWRQRAERAEAEWDAALAECNEQARLLGMGGSREAALMAERDALRECVRAADAIRGSVDPDEACPCTACRKYLDYDAARAKVKP